MQHTLGDRKLRIPNLLFGVAVAFFAVSWRVSGYTNPSHSDNIGMIVVPFVALILYLPVASVTAGVAGLILHFGRLNGTSPLRWLYNSQCVLVKVLAIFGVLFVLVVFRESGFSGVWRLLTW
jgi:hypothetical protein